MGTRDVSQCFSAQHEQSVQDVSFASGRRPQLQRLGACTERCTVQNASSVFEQRAQRACTQITTRAAHAHDLEAELIQVGGWDSSSDSEGGRAVEGSEEYFDESEHVDGFAAEERSSDGEEVDETRERGTEDARTVAGRAATTGRVDGEIQEELKRPSDCWYVPVCRVWGDSKEDA